MHACRVLQYLPFTTNRLHANLKETQESHQRLLNELIQKMSNLASSLESLTHAQSKQPESLGDHTCQDNPLFEKAGAMQIRAVRIDFPRFDSSDSTG